MCKAKLDDEYLRYVIKSCLILVASNYARVKTSFINREKANEVLRSLRGSAFFKDGTCSEDEARSSILDCAKIVEGNLEKSGFAIFAVNLMLKRLAPFFDDKHVELLDAPLNRKELEMVGAKKSGIDKMSSVNQSNYESLMKLAHKHATKCGAKSLYQWELEIYNE